MGGCPSLLQGLDYVIVSLHRGVVGLQCGVVPACRQAGTGKKAGKSFPSTEFTLSVSRMGSGQVF
jgi:hypothetical protein